MATALRDGTPGLARPPSLLFLFNFGFAGGDTPPCLTQADCNGDRVVNALVDGIFLLTFGFSGGDPPPAPFPNCGNDDNGVAAVGCDMPSCP